MLKIILIIFFIWKVFNLIIVFFIEKFIPYLGFFPYKEELLKYHLPKFIYSFANFDGIHYLQIAQNGYSQFQQAFFPLYPLLIRLLNPVFNNHLITGLLISNISFLIGLIVFLKYLKLSIKNFSKEKQIFMILLLVSFPTGFFFGSLYTEGLFFLLFFLTLYFLKKEKYLFSIIFGFLTGLTKLIGIFLIIPIIFYWLEKSKKQKISILATIFAPIFGFLSYCFYLWKTTGDPLMFFHSQPAFGANRSTNLILLPQVIWRYLKIFFTASFNFQYFISLFEFLTFFVVFLILILDFIEILKLKTKNFDKLVLNLFSFANILLPTLTGTLSSIPRYSLFSISFFIYITSIKNNLLKIFIIIFFLILQIIFLGFFSQGYFIS